MTYIVSSGALNSTHSLTHSRIDHHFRFNVDYLSLYREIIVRPLILLFIYYVTRSWLSVRNKMTIKPEN